MSKSRRLGLDRKLWLRIVAELGAADITEAIIEDDDAFVDGICEGGKITVNPVHATVDTIIHELLHRIYPTRSERSIRRSCSILRRGLSDEEVQLFYELYKSRRRIGRPRRTDV